MFKQWAKPATANFCIQRSIAPLSPKRLKAREIQFCSLRFSTGHQGREEVMHSLVKQSFCSRSRLFTIVVQFKTCKDRLLLIIFYQIYFNIKLCNNYILMILKWKRLRTLVYIMDWRELKYNKMILRCNVYRQQNQATFLHEGPWQMVLLNLIMLNNGDH